MSKYIINSNEYDGHHEVHNADKHCSSNTYPNPENQIPLGQHSTCDGAIDHAESEYPDWDVDGCAFCTSCHTE